MVNRPHGPSQEVRDADERARAVAVFLRDQDDRAQRAFEGEEHRARATKIRRGATIVTWLAIAYVWVGTPRWLTVEPPPVPTVEEESNALRLNVYLQSQRVEAYRIARRRLPYVLDEAGPRFRVMEYSRRDNVRYEITGRTGCTETRSEPCRVELQYQSQEAALAFVGEAADLVDEPSGAGGS